MKHLLPAPEITAVIKNLDETFRGMRQHDLWDEAGSLICSDVENPRMAKLKGADLDQLAFRDLDYLMSCAGLTIGTGETVRFLTPRYLKAFLNFPAFGWYTNGDMLRARFEKYDFDDWSRHQRLATANALKLMGRAMVLMADEFEADGIELIAWAEAKRTAALEEADNLRHKATMRKRVRGKGRKR